MQQVTLSISVFDKAITCVSALVASHNSPNCTISSCTVQSSNISSESYTGGFIGVGNSLVVISFSQIINSRIDAKVYAGGMIGFARQNIQISNSTVQNTTFGITSHISAFVGQLQSDSFIAFSADKAVNITIKCNTNAGGFIGLVDQSSNIMISECSVVNSSISAASNNAGAYLGSFGIYKYGSIMKIVKSNVSNVNVNAPSYFGIIVGFKLTAYSVSTSMPYDNNFVNSVKQPNCPNFADSCNSTTNISASDIYSAVTYNDTLISDTLIQCQSQLYISTFDILSVTNSLSGIDFANGYAFGASTIISNAFIDIQDGVYTTTVLCLFQSQSSFDNLKIQIGTQVIGSGSLVSAGSSIIINQVNIISKLNSTVTVNSTFKLNILMPRATSAVLNNLLLNLTISPSQGTVALIGSVAGLLNISGYQVLGFYTSQANIVLGAYAVNSSFVNINNVSFSPYVFNAGNMSSYLFSAVNTSTMVVGNISIVLGTALNPMLFNMLVTTNQYEYQFGGIAANLNGSALNISDVQFDAKQTYMIYYVQNFGLLLGITKLPTTRVIIQRVCLAHIIKSFTSFNVFGVIGVFEGILQFQQSNILISLQSADVFSYFGTIGQTTSSCIYTNMQQVTLSISVFDKAITCVSALVASHNSPNCTISSCTVQSSNISSESYTGGFIGVCNSLVVISFSQIINSRIDAKVYAGGMIGFARQNIQISNSTVQNTTFGITSHISAFVGQLQSDSFIAFSADKAVNITIKCNTNAGGFIGLVDQSSNIMISECSVVNSSISAASNNAGAYLGSFGRYEYGSIMKIVKSNVSNVNINAPSYFGIIVGFKLTAYSVSTSMPYDNNFVNSVKQPNCPNFADSCNSTTNISASDIYSAVTYNDTLISDTLIQCQSQLYISTFDILSVTNSLSGIDFANGYAFGASTIISNAFIDIQDGVYTTTVLCLFQSQSSFDNLKIQIGTQVIGSGSLVSAGSSIIINQVNIISKLNSTVTVNSTFKLNILMPRATSAVLNNLLLNLTISPSQGTVALIGSVAGLLNISGYQVLGFYTSQANIVLGAYAVNSSFVNINNVSFSPYVFNAGNMSSYLFSAVNTSTMVVGNISIVLGTALNPMLFNMLVTTNQYEYQFGGIAANLNSSALNISDVQFDAKQTYMIYYVQNFGLLLGITKLPTTRVIIQRVCLAHIIKSFTSFNVFGVIGVFEGILQFQQSNILISLQSADVFSYFGTIGQTTSSCIYTNMQQVTLSISVFDKAITCVSALVASHNSPNCTISSCTVQSSNISSESYTGGFIGVGNSLVVISFSQIINSRIDAKVYAGGMIGFARQNIQISNSTVQNTTFGITSHISAFVGQLQSDSFIAFSADKAVNITIKCNTNAGGFIGLVDQSSNIMISECSVVNSSISAASNNAGAYLGSIYKQYYGNIIQLLSSTIVQVQIWSPVNAGLVVGYNYYKTFTAIQCNSEGYNYVNNNLLQNCINFVNSC
ncbi:Conserved_hypothetical protein [Hexamita inflata]|uniref:Uncharacterized protein n=1 Tax=Hexamita inflata TaxID=28002 RepID=A0AA86V089_9EUKA|nr:Conserved hypothetical protein [Hexamita inflata]